MRTPAAALAALSLLAAPAARAQPVSDAQGPNTYLVLELGAFLPQANDLDAYDAGVALSGTFGAMFSPNVGAEASLGYYRAAYTTPATAPALATDTSLNVTPVLANLRLVAPFKSGELAARAGVGIHLASRHVTGGATSYQTDTAFGWQVGGSASLKLWPTMLVGVDVLATFAEARFAGVATRLDGVTVGLTLGYKL